MTMALRGLVKSTQAVAGASAAKSASVAHLYRAFSKELPRVMTIYDVDMPLNEVKERKFGICCVALRLLVFIRQC